MSLMVWLPLNGDLNNQGLGIITHSGNPIYKSNGKLYNKSLDLSQKITFNCTDIANKTKFTISFWAKVNSDSSLSNNWVDIIGFYDKKINESSNGVLRWETCYSSNFKNRGISGHDNATYYITGGPDGNATTKNEWHNIVCVVGDDVKEYRDGILTGTYTANGGCLTGYFWLGQTGLINGEINDVRIYDHALSPLEVKHLAQGLICNYTLSNFGMPNLLQKPISDNGWTRWYDNATTWNSSNISEKITDSNGKKWVHVKQTTSSGYGGVSCDPAYNGIIIDSSKKYTISALAKAGTATHARLVFWCHWRSTQGGSNLTQTQTFCDLSTNPQRVYAVWTPNGGSSSYTPDRINIMIGTCYQSSLGSNPDNEIYFTDVKFEEGEIATPWIPNQSDTLYSQMGLNSNIEEDVSGYGNNGTRIGTFSWSSDTPRYNVSTYASGSASTYLEGSKLPSEAKTVSLWIKCSKTVNSAIFNDKTSGLQIGLLNSLLYINSLASTAGFTTTHWINDEWNHVVAINNNGTRSVYVNGQPETQSGASNYYLHNSENFWLWKRSYNNSYTFTGSLSDLRIYVTALSADDVLELYHAPISLSNNGTLITHGEYVEV